MYTSMNVADAIVKRKMDTVSTKFYPTAMTFTIPAPHSIPHVRSNVPKDHPATIAYANPCILNVSSMCFLIASLVLPGM